MFDLERFCQSLHGLTRSEVWARCEERINYFESLERSARHRRGGQDPAEPEYDYLGYIEDIQRLMHCVFGGGSQARLSAYEAGLFQEVEGHIKD